MAGRCLRSPAGRRLLAALAVMLPVLLAPAARAQVSPEVQERLSAARAELAAGRPVPAESLYRQVLEAQPGWVDAHQGLAAALAAQGRVEEALAGLLEVGQALFQAELLEPAVRVLGQAAELLLAIHGIIARQGMESPDLSFWVVVLFIQCIP